MHIAAALGLEHDRDHLPGLGVIAEAGGVGHGECGLANVVDLHGRSFGGNCAVLRVRSRTWTPSSGGVLASQSGWLRVCAMSASPACQCSCIEARENS